ncbi:MAG: hypothetical protein JWO19_3870 [Bryobacterales bacterium]|jgi:hypothetical protein|nr:hypothetical protein [Bryobacterales bacterium]
MKIHLETIPHDQQRYPTVGDYWEDECGVEQVRVSEMKDWRYEILVGVHELIELALARHRGISEAAISDFDIAFEASKEQGSVSGEAGDHPLAPYRHEHFFATSMERLLAAELDVDWFEYERYVDSLGIKK